MLFLLFRMGRLLTNYFYEDAVEAAQIFCRIWPVATKNAEKPYPHGAGTLPRRPTVHRYLIELGQGCHCWADGRSQNSGQVWSSGLWCKLSRQERWLIPAKPDAESNFLVAPSIRRGILAFPIWMDRSVSWPAWTDFASVCGEVRNLGSGVGAGLWLTEHQASPQQQMNLLLSLGKEALEDGSSIIPCLP